ncbi:MAG: hypothetical protein IJN90_03730 [Bacilli bacterium]|nr:hypothetical protein [Bacilli bacterium]
MKKEIEDIEFDSVFDLYKRVKPALNSKIKEIKREKFDYIKEEDIWNYLIQNKWSKDKGLVLCDVVDDILHVDIKKLDKYVKEKMKKVKEDLLIEELDLI